MMKFGAYAAFALTAAALAIKATPVGAETQAETQVENQVETQAQSTGADLPPNFNPNSCYARIFIPARTTQRDQQVVVRDGYETLQLQQATYRVVEREIVLRPAYTRVEYVPPRFETRKQEIVTAPRRIEYALAEADFVTKDVPVKIRERYETWDANCSAAAPVAGASAEVLCRKVVPPEYKTIKREVVKRSPRLIERVIPAKTQSVAVAVMVQPPERREIPIAAKVMRVQVMEQVTPMKQNRIQVPARTINVPVEVIAQDARVEWRETVCDAVADRRFVREVQRALRRHGYNPGPIDGLMGGKTMAALNRFQRLEGLSQGGLLLETLQALGIRAR